MPTYNEQKYPVRPNKHSKAVDRLLGLEGLV